MEPLGVPPPPSMRIKVKPHQAFFKGILFGADRPRRRLSLPYREARPPWLLFLRVFFRRRAPLAPRWGRAAAEKNVPAHHHPRGNSTARGEHQAILSAGVRCFRAPGPDHRLSVWNLPRSQAPLTVYAFERPARLNIREPTHRTNGALAGRPATERRPSPTRLCPPRAAGAAIPSLPRSTRLPVAPVHFILLASEADSV
jgi:hypothetical protein